MSQFALPLLRQDLYKGQTATVCHVSAMLRKSPTADWEKKSVDATPTARDSGTVAPSACQCMRFALELGICTSKASIRTIRGRIVASLRCVTGPSLPDLSALRRASVLDCQSQTNQHCQPTQRCQTRTCPRSSEFILVKPSPAKKLSYSTSLIASGWAF